MKSNLLCRILSDRWKEIPAKLPGLYYPVKRKKIMKNNNQRNRQFPEYATPHLKNIHKYIIVLVRETLLSVGETDWNATWRRPQICQQGWNFFGLLKYKFTNVAFNNSLLESVTCNLIRNRKLVIRSFSAKMSAVDICVAAVLGQFFQMFQDGLFLTLAFSSVWVASN